jgi:hypothetical protein
LETKLNSMGCVMGAQSGEITRERAIYEQEGGDRSQERVVVMTLAEAERKY